MKLEAFSNKSSEFSFAFIFVMVISILVYCGTAHATTFDLDLTIDPSAGFIFNVQDVSANPGQLWESAFVSFTPTTVSAGDTISLNVTFSDNQQLEMQSGAFGAGSEVLSWNTPQPDISSLAGASTITAFTGVTGDLEVILPTFPISFTNDQRLSGTVVADFTDTQFAFTGFRMDTTYSVLNVNGTPGSVTISSLKVAALAEKITVQSVPDTSIMFLLGPSLMGLLGLGRRKFKS